MVAEGAQIKDKACIVRSIIGKNVIIGENTKISNSIVMRDAVISEE